MLNYVVKKKRHKGKMINKRESKGKKKKRLKEVAYYLMANSDLKKKKLKIFLKATFRS